MKQNNKKFNNAMHKFVGVLDKYECTVTIPLKLTLSLPESVIETFTGDSDI